MSEILNKDELSPEAEAVSEAAEAISEKLDEKADGAEGEAAEERVVIFEEALEAILFAAGHPISYATLARVFEMTPGKVKDKVFEYSLKYNDPTIPRGVILLTYGDSCQLCTKKYYLNEIRDALGIRKSGTLSTSSMEALAIVAYNQPVTRIFVDTLRRADSSYAMNNLIDRGLIEAQGRLDAPGRPMLYGTTPDFLRVFGLKDLSELPSTSEEITDMFAKGQNVEDTDGAVQEEMEFPELDGTSAEPTADNSAEQTAEPADEAQENSAEQTSEDFFDYENEPSAEDTHQFDELDEEPDSEPEEDDAEDDSADAGEDEEDATEDGSANAGEDEE